MAYKHVLLGDYFKFEKGLGYKGEYLVAESEIGLVGIDSQVPGGGYKENSEKPYSGPFKPEHVVQSGDVIVTSTDITQDGSVLGSTFMIPESTKYETLIYSGDVLKVISTRPEEFSPEYLYNLYRVEKYRRKLAYGDTGTTVRRISEANLNEQLVPLPDLKTQESINEIIYLIDQQIENNKSLAKNLEALAQSIFRSWFVDFDPVHAKARGEKPFGMDDETAALFPDSFEESELGLIPKGWKVSPLKELVNLSWGDTKTTKASYVLSGYLSYSASGPDGYLEKFDYSKPGIVLSAIGANCGRTWFANGQWSCIKNTIRLIEQSDSNSYLPFVYYSTNSPDFWPKRGSAQPFISQEDARNCEVVKPDHSIAAKFANIFYELESKMRLSAENNSSLHKILNSMLSELIEGNVISVSELV